MATTLEHTAPHIDPAGGLLCAAVTGAIRDLDTYRIGPVWYTVWHREQIPHGLAVEAFRTVTGLGVEIGQIITMRSPGGRIIARQRVTGITALDPTKATAESVRAICYTSEQAGLHPAVPGQPAWYITTESIDS